MVWVKNSMDEFWVLKLGIETDVVDMVRFQEVLAFS